MLDIDFITQRVEDKMDATTARLETDMADKKTPAPEIEHKSLAALMMKKGVDVDKRTVTAVANRPTADRDGEVIDDKAWDLKNFRDNPVLMLSHDYFGLPVGKVQTIAVDKKTNDLIFTAEFAPNAMGDELLNMYDKDFIRAFSVGFIPKKSVTGDEIDRAKFPDATIRRVFTKVELLEISCVAIPAHPEALVNALDSGEIKTKTVRDAFTEALDAGDKYVIGYRDYGIADIGEPWDAAKEVAAADVKTLRKMSTWFDTEHADAKSAYKLPHHKAADTLAVWRAISASMGILLGARGGTRIPADDRKGVYNHLAKHYGPFEKVVPEYREASVVDSDERVAWSVDDGDFIDVSTADDPVDWIGAKEVVNDEDKSVADNQDDPATDTDQVDEKVVTDDNTTTHGGSNSDPGVPVLMIREPEKPEGMTADMVKEAFAEVTADRTKDLKDTINEIVGDEVSIAFGKATRES